jgi:thiamine kinase-like enzyme
MSSTDRSDCYTEAMLLVEKIGPEILNEICGYLDTNISNLVIKEIKTSGNEVYQLRVGNNFYALHKAGRNRYISIQDQIHNVEIAHTNGLSPRCVWNDGQCHMLTEWVTNQSTELKPRTKSTIDDSIVNLLAQLHSTAKPFRNTFDASYGLNWNLRRIGNKPRHLQRVIEKAKQFLGDYPNLEEANCHGDVVTQNIVFDKSNQPLLIDWEFSHRNTPYWDIATLVNNVQNTTSEGHEFLRRYTELRNQHPSENDFIEDITLLNGYRGVLALISSLWLGLQEQGTVEQENNLLFLATTLLE